MEDLKWIKWILLIVLINCAPVPPTDNLHLGKPEKSISVNILESHYSLLAKGDSLYQLGQFEEAKNYYINVFDEFPQLLNTPIAFFKLGYCYYSLNRSDSAIFWMAQANKNHMHPLVDYNSFFIAKSLQNLNHFKVATRYYKKVIHLTQNEYLKAESCWELTQMFMDTNQDSARHYMDIIKFPKLVNYQEDYILLKVKLLDQTGQPQNLIKFIKNKLKQDWHRAVEDSLFNVLVKNHNIVDPDEKIDIMKLFIYRDTEKYFNNWHLVSLNETTLSYQQKAEVMFLKAIRLYRSRKWQSASQLLKEIKKRNLPLKYHGDYALYLARCQARLGFQNSAVKAYYSFQKKYPKHKLAGDALWWIALTFEQKNDYQSAKKYYNQLSKKYFNLNVGKEAAFRILFNDIKNKQYGRALNQIDKYLKKVDYDDKIRLTYWKIYCLEKTGNFAQADEEKKLLLQDPFQNYYSMKIFLKENRDSLHLFKDYAPYTVPSHLQLNERLQNKIDRVLIVNDVIGKKYARLEAKSLLDNDYNEEVYRLILAEMSNKLGIYDDAFSLNRRNYKKYFMSKKWYNKIGFIKNLYPLYYAKDVFDQCRVMNVDPLLVFALMKRESLFQAQVKSYANAYGLMQILPSTAKVLANELNYDSYNEPFDLFTPEINIKLGVFYLGKLLRQFDGQLPQVLASYNAGENRVEKWEDRYLENAEQDLFIELIPIDQTRKYVKFILYYYYVYQWFYRLDQGIQFYKPLVFDQKILNYNTFTSKRIM